MGPSPMLVSVPEAAALLDVHEETIRRHLRDGTLQGYKFGRRKWAVDVTQIPGGLLMERDEYARQMAELGLDDSAAPRRARHTAPSDAPPRYICRKCREYKGREHYYVSESGVKDGTCLDCLSPQAKFNRGLITDLEYRQVRPLPEKRPKRPTARCRACNSDRGLHRFPRLPDLCIECDEIHRANVQIEKLIAAGKESEPICYEKACRRCRRLLPLERFDLKSEAQRFANWSPQRRRKEICQDCRAGRSKSPYASRRETLEGRHTPAQWEMLSYILGYRCVGCTGLLPLTHDHILPVALEGSTNDISNMQPLCHSCNSTKHAQHINLIPCAIPPEWFERLPDTTSDEWAVGANARSAGAWTFKFPAPPYVYDWGLGHLVPNPKAPDIELRDGWRIHCTVNFEDEPRRYRPTPRSARKKRAHLSSRSSGQWQVRYDERSYGSYDAETAGALQDELNRRVDAGEPTDKLVWLSDFLASWYVKRPDLKPAPKTASNRPKGRITRAEEAGYNRTYRRNLEPVVGPLEQSDVPGVTQDRKSGDWKVYYKRPRASLQPGQRRVVYLTMFRDKELAEAVALEARRRCEEEGHEPEDKSWIRDFVALLDPEEAAYMMLRSRRMAEGFVPKYADPEYSDQRTREAKAPDASTEGLDE